MEGPGEFAEGLSIGVRSVFSGVVGGAAGTVSKVSVLAKGKGCSIIHAGFVLYLHFTKIDNIRITAECTNIFQK